MTVIPILKNRTISEEPYDTWIEKMKAEAQEYYNIGMEGIEKKEKIKYYNQRYKAKRMVEDIVRQIVFGN